ATVWGALRKMTSPAVISIGPGQFFTTGVAFQPGYDVTLRGAGRDATTLMSDRTTAIIRITLPLRVTIEALTIGRAREGATDTWGLEVRPPGAMVTMQDCRVSDLVHGISVWEGTSLNINDCVIERNRDGIHNRGDLTVTNTIFTANTIAFLNGGVANVSDTDFRGNGFFSTTSGAGTAAVSNNGQLSFRSVDIVDNAVYGLIIDGGTVTYNGGNLSNNGNMGIWQQQGAFTGQSLIIADNGGYGVNVGGRSDVADAGMFRLSQSAILRNYSAGIRIDSGEAHLQNDTISGNTATSSGGGGIWAYGGDVFLLDSTLVYNTGYGIHGSSDSGVITVRRSVIALNSDTECLVDSRISASYGTPGTYTCNDSMTAAVLKLGALSEIGGTWVYPLQDGSPLIDAGGPVATCPSVDQRGVSRPAGATCDIGAYEQASFALTAATPDVATIFTSTPEPIRVTFIVNAFCRKGPGTRYFDVGSFKPGDQAQVEGRNDSDPRWWWVLLPNGSDHCWVSSIAFEPVVNMELLPVQPAPVLPDAPAWLDDSPACNQNNNTRDVKLNWPGVPGATGFRIYRDSTLIASVGSDIAVYVDTVAYDKGVTYGLEAINKDGASEMLTVISGGC
ncbi:MAG TPA: hypothetical protein DCX53_01465, partial [Anaerolineae bacterium]|nr:hypothetical protein [Anaerolineae bacterium]